MITHIDILKLYISYQYQKLKNILQCLMHGLHSNSLFIDVTINDIETAIDRGIKKQSYPYWLFYCLNRITVQVIGVGRSWICHKYEPESMWIVKMAMGHSYLQFKNNIKIKLNKSFLIIYPDPEWFKSLGVGNKLIV